MKPEPMPGHMNDPQKRLVLIQQLVDFLSRNGRYNREAPFTQRRMRELNSLIGPKVSAYFAINHSEIFVYVWGENEFAARKNCEDMPACLAHVADRIELSWDGESRCYVSKSLRERSQCYIAASTEQRRDAAPWVL